MTDIIFNDIQYNIEKLSLKSKFFKDMKDTNTEITKWDFTDRGEAFLIILDYLVNDTYIKPNIDTPQLASELLDIIDELLITDDNLKNDINKIFKNHLDNCINMYNLITRLNNKIIFKEYPDMEYLNTNIFCKKGRHYDRDKIPIIGENICEWYINNKDMFLKYNDNIEKNSEKIQKNFPESYKKYINLIEKNIESKEWVRYMKNIKISNDNPERDYHINIFSFNTILQDIVYNVNVDIDIGYHDYGHIFFDNHLNFSDYISVSVGRPKTNGLYDGNWMYRIEDYETDEIKDIVKDMFKNIIKLQCIKLSGNFQYIKDKYVYYVRNEDSILEYNINSMTDAIDKNDINFIKKGLNIIKLDDEYLNKLELRAIIHNNNEILELLKPYNSDTRYKTIDNLCQDGIDIDVIHRLENNGFQLDLNSVSDYHYGFSEIINHLDIFKLSFSRNPMWIIKETHNTRSLKEENKKWSKLYQRLIDISSLEGLQYVFNDKKLFTKEHISNINRNIIPINIIEEYKNKEEISYIDYHHICSYLRKSKINTFFNKDTDISFIFTKTNRYIICDSNGDEYGDYDFADDDDYGVEHYHSERQVIDIVAYDKYKDLLLKLLNTDSFFEQIKLYNNTFKNILKWISTNKYCVCSEQQDDDFFSIDFDLIDIKEPISCSYHCLECGTCNCLERATEKDCLCNCTPFCRTCARGGIGDIPCRCDGSYYGYGADSYGNREDSYWHEDNWRQREDDRDDAFRRQD